MTRDLRWGRSIRALREAAGWSQADLAMLVNAACDFKWLQSTVQKIEAGSRRLTFADVEALTEVFGVGLDDLVQAGPAVVEAVRRFSLEGRKAALMVELEAIDRRIAKLDHEIAEIDREIELEVGR